MRVGKGWPMRYAPTMAAQMIGSVGVKQAEMTNADMNEREGKRGTGVAS